jgi:hypothetical protein
MRDHRWKVLTLITVGLAASALSGGTSPAADATKPGKPAKVEPIPGSNIKRVVLTPKAAQRLAIATAVVQEEPVMRWLVVEGMVEAVPEDPAETVAPAASIPAVTIIPATRVRVQVVSDLRQRLDGSNRLEERVRTIVSLSDDSDDDDDDDASKKDKGKAGGKATSPSPAIVIPDRGPARLPARPMPEAAASDDAKATVGAALAQVYEVNGADHGLLPGQRVHVRLPHRDSGKPQKVIPYSAVLYDISGNTWVYSNPEPLVFVRHPIDVETIEGDRAVLQQGPAIGTTIVTAGSAELLGVEQRFGQ